MIRIINIQRDFVVIERYWSNIKNKQLVMCHIVVIYVSAMEAILMEGQCGDTLSYVASGLIPLKLNGFYGMIEYFHFSSNNSWLQAYFKFVRKTGNIIADQRDSPAVDH